MPDYTKKNGDGVLFDNDRKESDRHPDFTGNIIYEGVEHWFSAWSKVSKKGNKFLSVSMGKPKEQQGSY